MLNPKGFDMLCFHFFVCFQKSSLSFNFLYGLISNLITFSLEYIIGMISILPYLLKKKNCSEAQCNLSWRMFKKNVYFFPLDVIFCECLLGRLAGIIVISNSFLLIICLLLLCLCYQSWPLLVCNLPLPFQTGFRWEYFSTVSLSRYSR